MYKTASRYISAIDALSGHSGWSAGLHVSSQELVCSIFSQVMAGQKSFLIWYILQGIFYESYLLGAGIHTKLLR
ncbi:MAG: hypothetical protein AMDU1_APLC00044G0016 [Thermoplasmatales archaeon A-plasma]|jgi:hypothetical protein|nr:MAG: hypothetical protein AMDU1_APLC00044G0016 [Thermoplasmatales archaeon A-plasma]